MKSVRLVYLSTRGFASKPIVDWTHPGKVLSVEQRQFYKKNGFLLVRNCVGKEDLKKYEDRFIAICERKVKPPASMLVMKDVSIAKKVTPNSIDTITKVQDFAEEPVLFSYCEHPRVTDVVRDLIGSSPKTRIQAMHTMLINKPPDTGKLTSRHPMHQDLIFFPWRPEDLTICAWTAMEKINKKNGCLQVVPGTQTQSLKPHGYPDWEGGVNKAYLAIKDYDMSLPREYVEMEAGDTVFFHPNLFHGSGANRSEGFRKAISCHYANYDHTKYIDVKGTIQEECAEQIVDIIRKHPQRYAVKPGQEVTFELSWRLRSRPVHHDGKVNL
uniref:phytanoyl-CoA dioxygenase n=1 Tax=Caenorhabditis tropicalis TaxID=1561998 RepID=A0A1I7SXV2_9PELO